LALLTVAAGAAGAPPVRRVTLDELAPSPESPRPTTARVRARTLPATGWRQEIGGVAVSSRCGIRHCLDGLVDRERKRELIAATPTPDERATLALTDGAVERVVHIAHVDSKWISVHLGGSEVSAGAHAANELACTAFDRSSGAKRSLSSIVTPKRARQLVARARRQLADWAQANQESGWAIDGRSFLVARGGRIVMCATAALLRAGEVLEIDVD
jgi:hypothetical protein